MTVECGVVVLEVGEMVQLGKHLLHVIEDLSSNSHSICKARYGGMHTSGHSAPEWVGEVETGQYPKVYGPGSLVYPAGNKQINKTKNLREILCIGNWKMKPEIVLFMYIMVHMGPDS